MPNIIGEEIEDYVAYQINARQKLHGSGVDGTSRNEHQLNVLNSQTSWIKLASGVSVSSDRLKDIGVSDSFSGMNLAKNWVLFSGTSKYSDNKIVQREGFNPADSNSSYTYGEFGYVPMPGITNTSIKTLNRGSLKKANVKLKVHDREQFEIIDLLYLRLGYTVLLEWGNSIYTHDGKSKEITRNTLIDSQDGFFNSSFSSKKSYLDILPQIETKRVKYSGNYDGLLGKVSNFDWTFNDDGSYDINLTIISLGDVIESLKTNISVDQGTHKFFEEYESANQTPADPPIEDPIEDNKDANAISFMLWAWKWVNREQAKSADISIKTPAETQYVAQFLDSSLPLTVVNYTYTYTTYVKIFNPVGVSIDGYPQYDIKNEIVVSKPYIFSSDQLKQNKKIVWETGKTIQEQVEKTYKPKYVQTFTKPTNKKGDASGITIKSPISDITPNEAFVLHTKTPQYYLRFGALLDFVRDNIVPIVDSTDPKPPIFEIENDPYFNWMYSLPNQVSLDPRVCLIRNDKFMIRDNAHVEILSQLDPFRAEDFTTISPNINKAYPMNVYLNFNFIIDSLISNSDERGDVNLFNFISSICDGLNKALGGVNNLEPVIEEETNTLKIIDTTPIPGVTKDKSDKYTLQLYGYDKVTKGNISNFIRKIDLKTAITPEYATMITVGATAGGYVKGTEATAFSKWNAGLTDRFKEDYLPSNVNSRKVLPTDVDEAETNYVVKFLDKYTEKYGLKGNLFAGSTGTLGKIITLDLSSDIIDRNLSVVTEYYKYLQAKNKEGGGSIGFIPFKLSLTMDGLSGMKIYNKLHVNTRFLPTNYGKTLDLIVTGVSHDLQNNDWETQIEATVIPKTTQSQPNAITWTNIITTMNNVGTTTPNVSLREALINAGYAQGTFAHELAAVIGTKEGYKKGSSNRPSRNNNPGNLSGSNFKFIDPGVTLELPNPKGERIFAKFTSVELGSKALVETKIKAWGNGKYPGTIVNGNKSANTSYQILWNVPKTLVGISGKGINLTIEQFFYIYAPPSQNNTEGYISSVVKSLNKNYPTITRYSKIIDWINK
jgi:hypothetical protein